MQISLTNVTGFLKVLTWKKIVQGTIVLLIIGTAYGFWENRIIIYNSLRIGVRVETEEPLIVNISSGTKNVIDTTLAKAKGFIAGIEIVNVDFKKNSRTTAYSSYIDDNLKKAVDKFSETRISSVPLFTEREVSNQKVIDLINGEFICQSYADTVVSTLIPKGAETVETVCAISIPPYYGRFSGYMNIYINRKLSGDDILYVRQLARDLSIRIYETDINRSARYQYN